jgi:hypothetical protein
MTAFQAVLEEIDFQVPATLLGEQVTVIGLTGGDVRLGLRARCRGKDAKGSVSLADLEFRPGTVEAWLFAAYLAYLGKQPPELTTPTGWDRLARWRS